MSNTTDENKNPLNAIFILKFLFMGFSIYLLAQSIFGSSHDVYGFYRSLFLLAAPIFFDAIDEFTHLFNKVNEDYDINIFIKCLIWIRFIASFICFSFPIISFMTEEEFLLLYKHIYFNHHWKFAIIFFALHCLCILIHIVLSIPLTRKNNKKIKIVERSNPN